ncbi:MAG: aminotransferase class V-fold PLP-dependent enzyme [Clostridia bacterium]|nr:aminotransferase class V-fold PLP-dependent enzyme [Clostridia bacterium]
MRLTYLDNAATTFPKPPGVSYAVKNCMDSYCGNPGRGAHPLSQKSAEAVFSVRERIAECFGGRAENVIFTVNATHAVNIALKSLLTGGHIIMSDMEHNAVVRPVITMGLKYSLFRSMGSTEDILCHIESLIRPDTRAVVTTAASNICPCTLPIREIGKLCRERGLLFIVDASQYAGHHPAKAEEWGITALCAPGHKGLYGPQGSGFVLFNDEGARIAAKGKTLTEGGNGVNSREPYMPEFLPERYEAGTVNVPAIVGLGEGLDFVRKNGEEALFLRESALYEEAKKLLLTVGGLTLYAPYFKRGNILLFNLKGKSSEQVARELSERNICVRGGLHCAPLAHSALCTPEHGAVRVSLGAFNTREDIHELITALKKP